MSKYHIAVDDETRKAEGIADNRNAVVLAFTENTTQEIGQFACRVLNTRIMLCGALDSLAVAFTNTGAVWPDELRRQYEQASEVLQSEPPAEADSPIHLVSERKA